jgi:hypothetical protein
MPAQQNIHRNIAETGENLYINRWWTGEVTQRSPLFTPVSALGLQIISRHDTLAGGSNMELSPIMTLARRYGWTKFCPTALGSSEYPLDYFSYLNTAGTLACLVDTPSRVAKFDSNGIGTLYNKATTNPTCFVKVGDVAYLCDGVDAYKYVGPNLLTYSNTFSNAVWTAFGNTLTGGQTDPNGGSAATQVAVSNISNAVYQDCTPNYTPIVGNTFTFSIWVKAVSGSGNVSIYIQNVGGSGGNIAVLTITPTSSWVRYTVTGQAATGATAVRSVVSSTATSTTFNIYGAQLEVGNTATPVVITSALPQGMFLWGIAAPLTTPTLSFVSGSLSPSSGYQYVYVYKNSVTGHISTASPVSANTGAQTSKNIQVGYSASTDPQVTNIDIYRTKDGGGIFYFCAEVANTTGTYTDSTPDSSLNTLLIAPQAGMNNPPPAGISLVTWYNDRLFATVNNILYASSGPDCTNGVEQESWNPTYTWVLPATITSINSTPFGMAIFTTDGSYLMQGQSTATYYPTPWLKNFGVSNRHCVTNDQSNMYVYTRRSQLWQVDASANLTDIGFPVGDQLLASYSPNSSSLSMHRNGNDVGLFISNGSTLLKRYCPNFNSWDPTATINGGVGVIASIETVSAVWSLLLGRPTGSGYILFRDTTSYLDDGAAYPCSAIIGSLLLAPPGETATLDQVLMQVMPVGTYPTVGVRMNEISGGFTSLPTPVNDPPQYDSTPFASASITSKRHYLKGAASVLPQILQHCQLQISFVAESARGEILGVAIQ